jgi:hypothetical protein
MFLGMSLQTFTLIHVLISLVAIGSGIIMMYGLLTSRRFDNWTAVFLLTTALTSLTGFLFPFTAFTPAIKLGIISSVVLAVAIVTRYFLHLAWRRTYAMAACLLLYFNVFVLVVQSFEKVPSLKGLAPTQKEPPFAIVQIAVLVLFCCSRNICSQEIPPWANGNREPQA